MTIDVARIHASELVERLQGMAYAAKHGKGLSPTGEALVVVGQVEDAEVLRAVVKEHCASAAGFSVKPN